MFFLQAGAGIREWGGTGVQTLALPISRHGEHNAGGGKERGRGTDDAGASGGKEGSKGKGGADSKGTEDRGGGDGWGGSKCGGRGGGKLRERVGCERVGTRGVMAHERGRDGMAGVRGENGGWG